MESILEELPFYGYRKMTRQLRQRGWLVNKKRVQRLMRKFNFCQKPKKRNPFTTNSSHNLRRFPNLIRRLVPSFPDQIWAADITYIRLGKGFCYLAAIIDVFTRNIRGWSLQNTLADELTLEALKRALRKGRPHYHHSDQGSQYCSNDYLARLEENQIKISMSDKGKPTQNSYAESFFRTIKVEEVSMMEYETIEDAQKSMERFIDIVYAKKRLHASLGYQTPEAFEAACQKSQGRALLVETFPGIEQNSISVVS